MSADPSGRRAHHVFHILARGDREQPTLAGSWPHHSGPVHGLIMDTSIVGVAPPEMQADLGFTPSEITICSLHVSPMASLGTVCPGSTESAGPQTRGQGIPPGGTTFWIDTQEVST